MFYVEIGLECLHLGFVIGKFEAILENDVMQYLLSIGYTPGFCGSK